MAAFAPASVLAEEDGEGEEGDEGKNGKPAKKGDEEPSLYDQIKKAIDNGVAYLKKCQNQEGGFGNINSEHLYGGGTGEGYPHQAGLAALALYALLKCGVPPTDPVIVKGFDYIHKKCQLAPESQMMTLSSYEFSTMIMALEAKYDRQKKHNIKATLDRKTASKRAFVKEPPLLQLGREDQKVMQTWVDQLMMRRAPYAWRYNKPNMTDHLFTEDLSSTQLAMLALRAASRCAGIVFDRNAIYDVINFILENQEENGPEYETTGEEDGKGGVKVTGEGHYGTVTRFKGKIRGFMYHKGSPDKKESTANGSMTTAGIASLIIAKSLLLREPRFIKEFEVKVDQAIRDGTQWLLKYWTVKSNPCAGNAMLYYTYYYLYGLERCGDLQGTLVFGEHYWYNEGAEVLVEEQKDNGAWIKNDTHMPEDVINTSFALLFLDRATAPVIIARYK